MNLSQELDQLVKQGKTAEVRSRLQRKLPPKLPRGQLKSLASICRRVGLANRGVVLLNRVVRGTGSQAPNPTQEEVVEYATCLVHAGAPEEALELLEGISGDEYPAAMMAEVFARVARWNYGPTIPILERYLDHSEPEPYQKLVAKANLGAAHLALGQYETAAKLLGPLELATRKGGYALLQGSTIQLLAQSQLFLGEWDQADESLDRALRLFSRTGGVQVLLVNKWKVFMELLREGYCASSARKLRDLRKRAEELSQWETLRECDRFEATAKRDELLLTHLYYGTEWDPYRKRILASFGSRLKIPGEYEWVLKGGKTSARLQVWDGAWEGTGAQPKPNQGIHRFIQVLSRDFYRPLRLPELHSRLFPDEYYNPFTSPKRVHRLLGRLRQWLEEQEVPLEVLHEGDRYRWKPTGPIALGLKDPTVEMDPRLEWLRTRFADRPFSSAELSEQMGQSRATAQRLLNDFHGRGLVERVRGGRKTQYRLVVEELVLEKAG